MFQSRVKPVLILSSRKPSTLHKAMLVVAAVGFLVAGMPGLILTMIVPWGGSRAEDRDRFKRTQAAARK